MNILFVTPRIPYPLDTGAKIRTFHLLKQAKDAGNKVTVLSFIYSKNDNLQVKVLEEMGVAVKTVKGRDGYGFLTILKAVMKDIPLAISKYRRKEMKAALQRLIKNENIDLVHFDHIHLGQYIDSCNSIPAVIDEHNVEALILKRLAKEESSFFKKLLIKNEYRKMKKFERTRCSKASKVFVVSEQDKHNLHKLCMNGVNIEIMPNGVDTRFFNAQTAVNDKGDEDDLVFTGSMDWAPNADAVSYFCNAILPLIWQEHPDVKFYIVGRNPTRAIRHLAKKDSRIVVVEGASDIRPFVRRAEVVVVPLRIGGGSRLKILEALSMEKAVISTKVGAEGLDVEDGNQVIIADEPQEFAQKIIALLLHEALRRKLGKRGRALVEQKYDWGLIGKKLNTMYNQEVVHV